MHQLTVPTLWLAAAVLSLAGCATESSKTVPVEKV
jgi:uncharacterized lipoprotein YajG